MAGQNLLKCKTYNVHLFGRVADFSGQPSCLYHRDNERVDEVIAHARQDNAHLLGFTEVWDTDMGVKIRKSLKKDYPYSASYFANQDVRASFENLRATCPSFIRPLTERIGDVVNYFVKSHYQVEPSRFWRGASLLIPENELAAFFANFGNIPDILGSGLLLLSKHPIETSEFIPHRGKADTDQFAQKGILRANIRLPNSLLLSTFLTHLQEGISPNAKYTRMRQIGHLLELAQFTSHAILMGDLNVETTDPDYDFMVEEFASLGCYDTFSLINGGDRNDHYTYDPDNEITRTLLNGRKSSEKRATLDYIWAKGFRRVVEWGVERLRGVSDHFPVSATILTNT